MKKKKYVKPPPRSDTSISHVQQEIHDMFIDVACSIAMLVHQSVYIPAKFDGTGGLFTDP